MLIRLWLLMVMLLVLQDAPSVPNEQRYHLEAINAKLQRDRAQELVLNSEFTRLEAEMRSLGDEHELTIQETLAKAGLKPEEWAVDESKTPYTFVKKPK